MAFDSGDSREDPPECPVCYESLSGTERTLSCGHVFCHDCLVKTLVGVHNNGHGNHIRDTLVCPICRHLTFLKKPKEALTVSDRDQTLVVPLPLPPPPGAQLQGARPATGGDSSPTAVGAFARCLRGISERVRRHKSISPDHNASQVFIISAEGRPMAEGDVTSVAATETHEPQRRRRMKICTTSRCLVILLLAFTLLAMVAAILPWVLLV